MKTLAYLLIAATLTASAQSIDFTHTLRDFDGQLIMNGDTKAPTPLTLGEVSKISLLLCPVDASLDKAKSQEWERGNLIAKFLGKKAAVLTTDEVTEIKDCIAQGPWTSKTLIMHATWPLLDPALIPTTASK